MKRYYTPETKISTIRLVIEYIFIINLFGAINANTIHYKLGQT
jgi:hypothetical protein